MIESTITVPNKEGLQFAQEIPQSDYSGCFLVKIESANGPSAMFAACKSSSTRSGAISRLSHDPSDLGAKVNIIWKSNELIKVYHTTISRNEDSDSSSELAEDSDSELEEPITEIEYFVILV